MPNNIKVVHVAETIKGGVATVLDFICRGMNSDERIEYFCLIPESQKGELFNVREESIRTFKYRRGGVFNLLSFFICTLRLILKIRPDVVHLHSSFAGFIGRIAVVFAKPWVNPKVIYCPHAFSFLMNCGSIKRFFYGIVELILSFASDSIICVSNYEREQALKRGIPAKKLVVIHNGCESPPEIKKYNHNEFLRREEDINLIFVGRLDYQKGFDVLLKAMDLLSGSKIKLTVVGSGVHDENKYEKLRNINFLGWIPRSEIYNYLICSDALLMPSRWEGFALTPIEAMSCGIPVISSDFPSLKEAVVDKYNGLIFENGNYEELAGLISGLSKRACEEMGRNARSFFLKSFTSEKMISKTISLYFE